MASKILTLFLLVFISSLTSKAQTLKTLPESKIISGAKSKAEFSNDARVIRWINKETVLLDSDSIQSGDWKLSASLKTQSDPEFILVQVRHFKLWNGNSQMNVIMRHGDLLVLENKTGVINELLGDPNILFIQKFDLPQVETNIPEHDLTVNHFDYVKSQRGLSGKGEVIGIKERSADTLDIDLREKFLPSDLADESFDTHATAMATIIGGRGNSSNKSLGAAGGASLLSSSFSDVFPDNQTFLDQITTQNHSYGFSIQNEYDALAASYDEAIVADENTLHVFSAGNLGFLTPESGPYAGLGAVSNLSGGIKQAKNTLVVGATDRIHQVDARSSRGPAFDGRIKPELVAYGAEGTSESAALVSSASALLQEQYRSKFSTTAPNFLLKSILLSSATDTEIEGPDFISGFGRLNLHQATRSLSQDQFFLGSISDGLVQEERITIPSNVDELRIALSWNDPAANIGDFMALVNDLDLEVEYKGITYLPLVPNANADLNLLFQPATEKRDSLNNNELAVLSELDGGELVIRVKGHSISTSGQNYALSYSFREIDSFEWLMPSEGVPHLLEEDFFLRYENTFMTVTNLERRKNSGVWEPVGPIIDHGKIRFETNGVYEFRAMVQGREFISPQILIHSGLEVQKLYECGNNLLFNWTNLDADSYDLYSVSDDSFDLVLMGRTNDTSSFLSADNEWLALERIAVKPIINGLAGLQSNLYEFGSDGIGCYVKSFTSAVDDGEVRLNLELTTDLNVSDVSFVREQEDRVFNFSSSPQSTLEYLGFNLVESNGYYTYKGLISLDNSELGVSLIETPIIEIPIIIPEANTLFPNPVPEGDELFFLGSDEVSRIRLFSTNGNYTTVIFINQNEEFFELKGIASGLYFYQLIDRQERVIKTGKLIIE